MLPTPDLSHLTKDDFEHVYDPAEDTFILLDALEEDQEAIKVLNPRVCLELGSGSGCVSAFLTQIVGASNAAFLCTDINFRAAQATERTGKQNKVTLSPILTSLHYPLLPRLQGKIDILLFNPPYVPTEDEEEVTGQHEHDIAAAWAGGSEGMTISKTVLQALPTLLSPRGRFYLVAIQQNHPETIIKTMASLGIQGRIVLKRRAGGEVLYVLCFTRMP